MPERDSITFQERYAGAKITSRVLKAFAILWIVVGVLVLFRTDRTYTGSSSGISLFFLLIIEGVATVLGAAMFAFFAYVLDVLLGIWEETAGEND